MGPTSSSDVLVGVVVGVGDGSVCMDGSTTFVAAGAGTTPAFGLSPAQDVSRMSAASVAVAAP